MIIKYIVEFLVLLDQTDKKKDKSDELLSKFFRRFHEFSEIYFPFMNLDETQLSFVLFNFFGFDDIVSNNNQKLELNEKYRYWSHFWLDKIKEFFCFGSNQESQLYAKLDEIFLKFKKNQSQLLQLKNDQSWNKKSALKTSLVRLANLLYVELLYLPQIDSLCNSKQLKRIMDFLSLMGLSFNKIGNSYSFSDHTTFEKHIKSYNNTTDTTQTSSQSGISGSRESYLVLKNSNILPQVDQFNNLTIVDKFNTLIKYIFETAAVEIKDNFLEKYPFLQNNRQDVNNTEFSEIIKAILENCQQIIIIIKTSSIPDEQKGNLLELVDSFQKQIFSDKRLFYRVNFVVSKTKSLSFYLAGAIANACYVSKTIPNHIDVINIEIEREKGEEKIKDIKGNFLVIKTEINGEKYAIIRAVNPEETFVKQNIDPSDLLDCIVDYCKTIYTDYKLCIVVYPAGSASTNRGEIAEVINKYYGGSKTVPVDVSNASPSVEFNGYTLVGGVVRAIT